MAPLNKVWEALVDPKVIDKWGAGPAKMSDKEGSEFKLWGGDIHGTNIKVVKNKKMTQEWYGENFKKASRVTFTLTYKDGRTTVYLLHESVPDDELDDISDGWQKYYLGEIKNLLEQLPFIQQNVETLKSVLPELS